MKKLVVNCICILFFASSCGTNQKIHSQQKQESIFKCYESWVYEKLKTEQQLMVLIFNPKQNHGISSFPNFLIGTTIKGDTVALLDIDYEKMLKYGDFIVIDSGGWTSEEMELKKPLLTIHKKTKENELYCIIDTVFYGCIRGYASE